MNKSHPIRAPPLSVFPHRFIQPNQSMKQAHPSVRLFDFKEKSHGKDR